MVNLVNKFIRRLLDGAPNSSQVVGFLTLAISGGILLLLAGFTLTAAVMGLIILTPAIILFSPIWIPAGFFLTIFIMGFVSFCAFGVAVVGGGSWLYQYFRGLHPPGSGRVDYARSRIADTANHVKDYARGYGGYLQRKIHDAAPGA